MFAALFSVLLIASETAAVAPASPSATTIDNGAAETPDPSKKICKRQQVTGQLQGTKRVCMTPEQWKRVQEAELRSRR